LATIGGRGDVFETKISGGGLCEKVLILDSPPVGKYPFLAPTPCECLISPTAMVKILEGMSRYFPQMLYNGW